MNNSDSSSLVTPPFNPDDEHGLALFTCMLDALALNKEWEELHAELEIMAAEYKAVMQKRDELHKRYTELQKRNVAHKANCKALGVYE